MRNSRLITMAAAVAVTCGVWSAMAAALHTEYRNPGYLYGPWDNVDSAATTRRFVPTKTAALVCPGATLEELLDASFQGLLYGSAISNPGLLLKSNNVWRYPSSGTIQWLLVTPQRVDQGNNGGTTYIKAPAIKLTQGADGVYAQRIRTCYRASNDNAGTVFVQSIAADGAITWNYSGAAATSDNSWGAGSYGCLAFNAMKWVNGGNDTLMFKNGPDEPVLTVDDIKDYRFTGVACGGSVNPNKFAAATAENVVITETDPNTGKATKMRLEMQFLDDRYIKSPIIELSNGADGVYAKHVGGPYINLGVDPYKNCTLGYHFLNADGSITSAKSGNSTNYATEMTSGNYGIAGLSAYFQNKITYILDGAKTWSQLTGSSDPVNDDSLNIVVKVTAADASLTFDTAVTAASLAVESTDNHGVAFALAQGTTAPMVASWDFRNTEGTIVFNDFTPVNDAVCGNLVPNALQKLVFNGPLHGFLPFNNTPVKVGCAEIEIGGDQTFASLAVNKCSTVPITVTGNFKVTGAFTLATGESNFTFANGSTFIPGTTTSGAATLNFAAGAKLRVDADATIADVTFHGDGDTVIAVKGPATKGTHLVVDPSVTFDGASLVLDEGVVTTAYAQHLEDVLTVTTGGELAIEVSEMIVFAGYTSATTVDGTGSIRFYIPPDTEVGIGRSVMNVLPASAAIWSPVEDDDTMEDARHWTGGAMPAENGDAVFTSGDDEATVEIGSVHAFGRVVIGPRSRIAFAQGGADYVLSATEISVADDAVLTLPAGASSAPVTLGKNAQIVITGDGTYAGTIASTDGGKVVFDGGTILVTQRSTYTCGTIIKTGTRAIAGVARGTINGNYCGPFGRMIQQNPITVEDGGTVDLNTQIDLNYWVTASGNGVELADGESFAGAIYHANASSVYRDGTSMLNGLDLAGDTTINASGPIQFLTPGYNGSITWNLGEYTLTKTGADILYAEVKNGLTINGTGTFSIQEGTFQHGQKQNSVINAANTKLMVGADGKYIARANATYSSIENNGLIELYTACDAGNRDITLNGVISGNGELHFYSQNHSCYVKYDQNSRGTFYVHGGRMALTGNRGNYPPAEFNTAADHSKSLRVIVEDGGQFDMSGQYDIAPHVIVAGKRGNTQTTTALTNLGGNITSGQAQIQQLTLAADASVGGSGDFGILSSGYRGTLLELGAYTMTLTHDPNKCFWLCNATVTGTGKLFVNTGYLCLQNRPCAGGQEWTLENGANGHIRFNQTITVGNLIVGGPCEGTALVTAYGTYAPNSATLPTVKLTGANAGLDLSAKTETWPLASTLSFDANTQVKVKTGSRTLTRDEVLISWDAIPANVTKWKLESGNPRYEKATLTAKENGLIVSLGGVMVYVR